MASSGEIKRARDNLGKQKEKVNMMIKMEEMNVKILKCYDVKIFGV